MMLKLSKPRSFNPMEKPLIILPSKFIAVADRLYAAEIETLWSRTSFGLPKIPA